jgi:hypothetical protein
MMTFVRLTRGDYHEAKSEAFREDGWGPEVDIDALIKALNRTIERKTMKLAEEEKKDSAAFKGTAEAVRKIAQAEGLTVREHKTLLAAATLIEVQARLLKERGHEAG